MDSGIPQGVSGAGAASSSSKAKKLKMSIGMTPRPTAAYKPFAELSLGDDGDIKAMVCRAWETKNPSGKYLGTEYIFADEQGSALHCIARSSIAHCVVPKLEVGNIYSISKFSLAHNKLTYRVRRNDDFLIHLEGNTNIKQLDCPATGFVRHPFELQPLDEITFNGNKYLIDVVGRVVNLGVPKPTTKGTQYIDFHLIDERAKTIKVTLWGGLCAEMRTRCEDPEKCYIVVLPAMSVREYRGELHLSSTSGTSVYDSLDIPAIANLASLMREGPLPQPSNIGTLLQLLQLGRQQKEDNNMPSVTLICKAKISGIRARNSWNYYSCGLNGCKKGLTPHTDHFWCESCETKIEFPLLRYRLHLDILDSTTTIVATVFDDTAELLVKKQAKLVLDSLVDEAEGADIPNDIMRLVGTEHVFEFKSHTYYNHGYYESFTVSRVLPYIQPPTVCNPPSANGPEQINTALTIPANEAPTCCASVADAAPETPNPPSTKEQESDRTADSSTPTKRKMEALHNED